MKFALSLALLCFLSAAACAAERYDGVAFARGTDRLVYRETDWLFTRDGVAQRLTLYRCPDGRPFARKRVAEVESAVEPDFELEDGRDGYREGVRTVAGTRQIFVRESSSAPLRVGPLPRVRDGVIDAGFDAFVRAHWSSLEAGKPERLEFLVPGRFRFVGIDVSPARDAVLDGRPGRRLEMTLSAWYGFMVPSIDLVYDPQGRYLEEYQGIGTIRERSGRGQDVRIEFPSKARHAPVADQEIDRAAAEPLAAGCAGESGTRAAPGPARASETAARP